MFFNGEEEDRTVGLDELTSCLKNREISITKEEIKDRGRGDMLSKGLVVIQTGWFILQCIARRVQHLPITELELVTLAFAALNFVTYGLWWNKPLDVQCPLRVHRRVEESEGDNGGNSGSDNDDSVVDVDAPTILKNMLATIYKAPVALGQRIVRATASIARELPATMRKLAGKLRDAITRAVHYIRHPDMHIFLSGIVACLKGVFYPVWLMGRLGGGEEAVDEKSFPTFYAGDVTPQENWLAAFAGVVISTIFGAIHCTAWSFQFPSHTEQFLWRFSSLAITCVPVVLFVAAWICDGLLLPGWLPRWLPVVVYGPGAFLYILARIALLVMPFVDLRALPPGANQEVDWTAFIPHVL